MRNEEAAIAAFIIVYAFIFIFIFANWIVTTIAKWKLFEKAGIEGWKAIIPYYNAYVLTVDLAGKDLLMFVFHFVPFLNIYAAIMTNIAVAKSFGKDTGYGIGLTFLAIIFYPMLALDKSAVYLGPDGNPRPTPFGNVNQMNQFNQNPQTNWQNDNNAQQPPLV